MLMLVLIVAVAACLAVGLVLGKMLLVWCALGASVLGMLPLGYLLCTARRSSRAEPAAAESATATPWPADAPEPVDAPVAEEAQVGHASPVSEAAGPPVAAGDGRAALGDPDGIVHVVPGRRRFHVDGCRLLTGKPAEEISLDEAREEGFTACTSCVPDREALPTPR